MNLQVYGLAWPITALGPGRRAGLWLSGCRRACPGCMTPELHDPKAGRRIRVDFLARRLAGLPGLDGITVTGGEPMDQAAPLAGLLSLLAGLHPDWTVIVYSGYGYEELLEPPQRLVLKGIDLLVDGPYRNDMPATHPLAGSGNQRLIPLTRRGAGLAVPAPRRWDLARGDGPEGLLITTADEPARTAVRQALGLTLPIPDAP